MNLPARGGAEDGEEGDRTGFGGGIAALRPTAKEATGWKGSGIKEIPSKFDSLDASIEKASLNSGSIATPRLCCIRRWNKNKARRVPGKGSPIHVAVCSDKALFLLFSDETVRAVKERRKTRRVAQRTITSSRVNAKVEEGEEDGPFSLASLPRCIDSTMLAAWMSAYGTDRRSTASSARRRQWVIVIRSGLSLGGMPSSFLCESVLENWSRPKCVRTICGRVGSPCSKN